MNAAIAYFRVFVDGELDSFSTHAALIGVIAAAEIGLAIGIWLESPKDKGFREWLGVVLVLGGCVFSVVATVLLLIFDEGISRSQQSKIQVQQSNIIRLETQLAVRSLDRAQVEAIKSIKGKIKTVNLMSEASLEPNAFSGVIAATLQSADVDVKIYFAPPGVMLTGIEILYPNTLEEVGKEFGDSVNESLFRAFQEARLLPGRGSLKNWFPFVANIPRDEPLIFVGEKYLFITKNPYEGLYGPAK